MTTVARRKSRFVPETNSEENGTPMNVNINIACSIDPRTGASKCRISHPTLVPEEDDMVKRIELARKQDLEELEEGEEEEELESDTLKSKTKKSKRDSDADEEVDSDDEDQDGSIDSKDDSDEEENEEKDEILECITKSKMKKR